MPKIIRINDGFASFLLEMHYDGVDKHEILSGDADRNDFLTEGEKTSVENVRSMAYDVDDVNVNFMYHKNRNKIWMMKNHGESCLFIKDDNLVGIEKLLLPATAKLLAIKEEVPMNLSPMIYKQLVEMLVNFLHPRKYVIVLDDAWSIDLCGEINVALANGLPLVIVALAVRMSTKKLEFEWGDVHNSLNVELNKTSKPLLNKVLHGFKLLGVLDLENLQIVKLPNSVVNLFNLRYLNLTGTQVKWSKFPIELENFTTPGHILTNVRQADEKDLCVVIDNMKLLHHLFLKADNEEELLRMDSLSSPPCLEKLKLVGKWEKKLKILNTYNCHQLNEIVIEKGVMPGLQSLSLGRCMELKALPHDIEYLTSLQEFSFLIVREETVGCICGEGSVGHRRFSTFPISAIISKPNLDCLLKAFLDCTT
ncbi:unnamed protein product [Dovyalis caffra]|uniref:NB-ARC domain-containing protein n=1 Tax=Dovyalis caffra TaxID=77055 RepID=A0AAV1RN36_9ROSI|nr:unnamed protein product [Dovyalis caffra]